jgi:hypothetical protein
MSMARTRLKMAYLHWSKHVALNTLKTQIINNLSRVVVDYIIHRILWPWLMDKWRFQRGWQWIVRRWRRWWWWNWDYWPCIPDKNSHTKKTRTALFWVITQRIVVIYYRPFGPVLNWTDFYCSGLLISFLCQFAHPVFYSWVLISPGSVRDICTTVWRWAMTSLFRYCFVLNVSIY